MKELLTGITPGNNLGCPGCGCGGDSCGADGCICCRQVCVDVQVRDATPAGFGDEFGEWFRISTEPLSMAELLEPAIFASQVHRGGKALSGTFIVSDDADPSLEFGYCWVEFIDAGGAVVRYYAPMQEPSKIWLSFIPGHGWAVKLDDTAAAWIADSHYSWRFVAMKRGDDAIEIETTGELEA